MGLKNHNIFIVFAYSLFLTLLTVLIQTCIELSKVNAMSDEEFAVTARLYEFMPKDIGEEKIIYQLASWLVILTCVFFTLVIFALNFLQTNNFLQNRTTSERFSRKKPPTRRSTGSRVGSESSRGSVAHSESIDSTGSSLASDQPDPRQAEDIIREYGEVPDYTGRSCVRIRNMV